jgi:hypothetical protein
VTTSAAATTSETVRALMASFCGSGRIPVAPLG